jgi:hypothetical protein
MTTYGYLELQYLNNAYLASVISHAVKSQVTMVVNTLHVVPTQSSAEITTLHVVPTQVQGNITGVTHAMNTQTEMVVNTIHPVYSQVDAKTSADHSYKTQVLGKILSYNHDLNTQIKAGVNLQEHCEDYGYLNQPYLKYNYVADYICTHQKSQVLAKITDEHKAYSETEGKIFRNGGFFSQVLGKVYVDRLLGSQVVAIRAKGFFSQARGVLYNTTNLRILSDFASRGVETGTGLNSWGYPIASGLTWKATSTEAGHFDPNNLNTDVVEEVWRSAAGQIAGVILSCDTEVSQGIFLDTFAILNHNLSLSASVVLQGSNVGTFATVGVSETLYVIRNHENIYYIAPTLPTESYRYWRVVITDLGNADNFLQIGTIVFGSSIIFQGECFVDEVTKSTKHFSDKVETEGFTNVSNDRALKYAVGLDFRRLRYNKGNYSNLRGVFDFARTNLKCLWIPTPEYPERFAVFGKLPTIPVEKHNVKGYDLDYVDFTIEVDESL